MKRRSFLQNTTALGIPLLLNGFPLTGLYSRKMSAMVEGINDRVLVLIQLVGGNDGLNTIFSMDQFANLAAVRPDLILSENDLLDLDGARKIHPSLPGLKELWDEGKLNILQNVGYPFQNRSHFRSTDIWHTASEADEYLTTGWLGRFFEVDHADYPDGYPNADFTDPFALTIGGGISETCQGTHSTFSLAVVDPSNPGSVDLGVEGDTPNNCYGRELSYIREVATQTNAYAGVIEDAASSGSNLSTKYADNNPLAQRLKTVAQLISGGLETKVYVVSIGSFDTHASQVEADDKNAGRHAVLFDYLSNAICAFQEDLEMQGLDQRVFGMTYSEFGRRIRQNESLGTDHGTAAPMIFFGSCVNPEIIGDDPEIDRNVDIQEGVAMQYDFRSAYGTVLENWFGVDAEIVKNVMFEDYQSLPIIQGCEIVNNDEKTFDFELSIAPNPVRDNAELRFTMEQSNHLRIEVYDAIGSRLEVLFDKKISSGTHSMNIGFHKYKSGSYFVRLISGNTQKTKKIVKA